MLHRGPCFTLYPMLSSLNRLSYTPTNPLSIQGTSSTPISTVQPTSFPSAHHTHPTCLALITELPLWDCDGCRGLDLSPWFPKDTSAQLLPLPAEWWKQAGSQRSAHHSPICLEQRLLNWCLPWLLHHAAVKCFAHKRILTGIKWSDKYAMFWTL